VPPRAQTHVYMVADPSQVCQLVPGATVMTAMGPAMVNASAVALGLGPPASVSFCAGGKMTNASLWLGIAGLLVMAVLMSRSYKGPIILGARAGLPRARRRACSRPATQLARLVCCCSRRSRGRRCLRHA